MEKHNKVDLNSKDKIKTFSQHEGPMIVIVTFLDGKEQLKIQLAARMFYDQIVPQAMKYVKFSSRSLTVMMLNTVPIGDNVKEKYNKDRFEDNKKLWQLTHAHNIGLLIESYQRFELDGFPNNGESEYAEWNVNMVFNNGKFFGMRHRETAKAHGLVRVVFDYEI